MDGFIVGSIQKKIFQTDLAVFPQFLRFDAVELCYWSYTLPIAKKCHLFAQYLKPLKKALNDSNLIHFDAIIYKNDMRHFSGHSQLLCHLREDLLPICDSSRAYKFEIRFFSDKSAGYDVIDQILQMHPINRGSCSKVEIILYGLAGQRTHLPLKTISNWLHRNLNGTVSKERFLRINSYYIPYTQELCDYLKKVLNLITTLLLF